MKAIRNCQLYVEGAFHSKQVVIFDTQILRIESEDAFDEETFEGEIIDGEGHYLVPGFIDVHIHGFHGSDVMEGTQQALSTIRKGITQNGVTAFLPTTMTMSMEDIERAFAAVEASMDIDEGASILGIHMEGPFINPKYKGAQKDTYIRLPDIEWMDRHKALVKVITLAPEQEGAMTFIDRFHASMNISIGHTNATYDEAMEAIEHGAKSVTHLFNAMTGLNHRNPGVVGASFTTDTYAEMIADNVHIRPELYEFVLRVKGMSKVMLITDCMRAGGLDEGVYDLGGQDVTVKEGKCTLASGTIAGSILKLNDGLKHVYEATGKPLETLIPLVTENQAKYLGCYDERGSIDPGKWADFVLIDQDITVLSTYVKGNKYYEKNV